MLFSPQGQRHSTSAKWNEGRTGERWELWAEKNSWKPCLCFRLRWSSRNFRFGSRVFSFQVDALLEFDCSAQDLNNGVINCSFMLLFRDLIRSQMQVISILIIIFIQVVCLLQWWRDKPAWKVFRHAKEGSQRCFRCVSLFNTSTTVFSLRRSLQEVLDTDGSRCWIPQSGRGEISS